MSCVIYLANWRRAPASSKRRPHPEGKILPFVGNPAACHTGSKVGDAIRSSANRNHLIKLLAEASRKTAPPDLPEPA